MIECIDCIDGLKSLEPGSVDLIFADPPFNIDYGYDLYNDSLDEDDYLAWCRHWLARSYTALSPTGAMWVAIGDDMSPELACLAKEMGFFRKQHCVWYYTFGVNCKKKFTRSHTNLWWLVKDYQHFTFNPELILEPSYRQLHGDKRAAPGGRIPDDVWNIPRVAGTHKERCRWHPCQMPLAVLQRIILSTSNPGDLVVDIFSGSGTTGVVCVQTGRQFLGYENSPNYTALANRRISESAATFHGF